MWSNILAAVVGYIVMSLLVGVSTLVLALPFAGILDASEQGVSPPALYLALNLASAFLSAVAGGFVCNGIARGKLKVTLLLASIVGILAVFFAWTSWGGAQPDWYLLTLIVLGPSGVASGGLLHRRLRRSPVAVE